MGYESTIELIKNKYKNKAGDWVLGFSGGKDSSAVLRLVYQSLLEIPKKQRKSKVHVIYCDTGVEIPTFTELVERVMTGLEMEAKRDEIPLVCNVLRPRLNDRFFVKVIGRGYPPPTNKFRWCTDRLRIKPVTNFINKLNLDEPTIVLGLREGESRKRSETINKHRLDESDKYELKQAGNSKAKIFAPLLDYDVEDVWGVMHSIEKPEAIDSEKLLKLYLDADAECPVFEQEKGKPCGAGRFGCWTCTVVSRDRAVGNMVNEGYTHLEPLLAFRDWLAEYRNKPSARCRKRRNGMKGPGPLTLQAREIILGKLVEAQRSVPWNLIREKEIARIKLLWDEDKNDDKYLAIE